MSIIVCHVLFSFIQIIFIIEEESIEIAVQDLSMVENNSNIILFTIEFWSAVHSKELILLITVVQIWRRSLFEKINLQKIWSLWFWSFLIEFGKRIPNNWRCPLGNPEKVSTKVERLPNVEERCVDHFIYIFTRTTYLIFYLSI